LRHQMLRHTATQCVLLIAGKVLHFFLNRGRKGTILFSSCFRGLALSCYQNHSLF